MGEMSSESTLPPDWEDDERMNFLFSDFKENREVNTTDWDSKMDFWTSLIVQNCRRRGTVCVNLQDLNDTFRRKGNLPLGLGTVIQSMARCSRIQRESEFAANVDSGWLSWGVGLLLVKPLKWTFSTLLGRNHIALEESFVVIELVKEKAAELLAVYRSSPLASCTLLSFQELCTLASHVCVDESTLCVALLELQREKQVVVALKDGEKIVKFSQPGQNRISPVSDVDMGIYQLQRSEKLLEGKVEALGQESEKCREEAKVCLRQGKKPQALRCLRSRKRVEMKADRLHAQIETIKGILDRVAHSQTDKLVVQAYQAGVAALQVSLKDVTVERAESLVDQIQELCDNQDEVSQALSGGGLNQNIQAKVPPCSADVDTEELEEELESILRDSELVGPSTLPDVPTHPLSPATEPCVLGDDLLSSLPSVPQNHFNITDEELDIELSRLTLTESGMISTTKRLEPAQ